MSNPPNPLAKYRSHRYFHVLAMCDSTETAESLITEAARNPNVWFHKTPNENDEDDWTTLGKRGVKHVKNATVVAGEQGAVTDGRYCILINGATDADWVITSAKWSSIVNASATKNDGGGSIAVEGSLLITEPRGIVLTDTLVLCCLHLGVDSSQVVYVLKTFFVGWTDDNDFDTQQATWVSDITPLMFSVYDLTGTFTEKGGAYELQFVAQANGVSRLPQYSKMPAGITLNLQANGRSVSTIAESVDLLRNELMTSYLRYYDCVIAQLSQSADSVIESLNKRTTSPNDVPITKEEYLSRFTPVSYKITVSPELAALPVQDFVDQEQAMAGCGFSGTMAFPAGSSIEDAIRAIAMKSLNVQKMMKEGDPSRNSTIKYEPKIQTAVSTKRVDESRFEVEVHYHLYRTPVGTSVAERPDLIDMAAKHSANPSSPIDPEIKNNLIEFDYLYTGKNIDILEFDVKMNMGLAYLQTATLTNTLLEQFEQMGGNSTHVSDNRPDLRFNKPTSIPIFFGTHYNRPGMFNMSRPADAAGAAVTIASHASLEMADSTIKILGNYWLLNSTNRRSVPSTMKKIDEERPDTPKSDSLMPDFGVFPSLARINIKMPTSSSDLQSFQSAAQGVNGQYAKSFWFNGFYLIYSIEHEFTDGSFTQTLHMTVVPVKPMDERSSQAPIQFVDACSQKPSGCGGSTVSQATSASPSQTKPSEVPFSRENGAKTAQPTNLIDSSAVMNSVTDLSAVPHWSSTSPIVRNAILQASSQYNIDPMLMARVASKESKLNPDAKNNRSSATGLYQFIDDTWIRITRSPGVPAVGPVTSPNKAGVLQKRYDPLANAQAAALLFKANADYFKNKGLSYAPSDLYLAHVLGAPRAAALLTLSASGKGDQPISDNDSLVKGDAASWGHIKRLNRAAFDGAQTANEARTAIAKFLSLNTTGGIPVTQTSVLTEVMSPIPRTTTALAGTPIVSIGDKVSQARDCRVEQRAAKDPEKGSCQDNKAATKPNQTSAMNGRGRVADPGIPETALEIQQRYDQSD